VNPDGDRRFHGPRDYLELARSPAAAVDDLRMLADSPYSFVLEAVALHPSTPADVLERLLPIDPENTIGGISIMRALAAHPAATASLLQAIAAHVPRLLHNRRDAHAWFEVGIALFSNPSTPDVMLLRLLDDPQVTTQFRKVAARETNHPAVLDRLTHDPSETVRHAAAKRDGRKDPA
jgi:hypothetical protein